tara:strand:- start:196 stop:441 length:246 start_codon:yes stop_codon:yes gene_type:complete
MKYSIPDGWQTIFNSINQKFYLSPDGSKKFSSLKKVERFLNGTAPKKEWVTPDASKYTTKKRILVTKKKEKLSKRARTECK